jgi:hypothetical protein
MYALAKHSPLVSSSNLYPGWKTLMLQRSSGFLPPVHTTCRVGFGVFSVKPGCHSSGSIRNYLVYLPPAHRVKKTPGSVFSFVMAKIPDFTTSGLLVNHERQKIVSCEKKDSLCRRRQQFFLKPLCELCLSAPNERKQTNPNKSDGCTD